MTLEICANSLQSALNAQKGGANRVELCENLWEGGTTPSFGTLIMARKLLKIELLVLARPRGGDFVYSDLEFDILCQDILQMKVMGIEGIVSGVLNPNGTIDKIRTQILVEFCSPLPLIFHRAFDCTPNPQNALEDLIHCGVKRVLTSGQKNSAIDGLPLLKELHHQAAGRIEILPGGGLNGENIAQLIPQNPCGQIHLTAKAVVPNQWLPKQGVNMNGSPDISEKFIYQTDVEIVKKVRKLIDEGI